MAMKKDLIDFDTIDDRNNVDCSDRPQLPVEIVMDIMSYLSMSDRMSAGLVNRDWREASLSFKYIDEQVLLVSRQGSDDNLRKVVSVLRNSHRPFHHFVFKEVELRRNLPIWDQFGGNMRALILISCSLSEKTLVDILKCCKSLRTLRINGCRECLMSGRLLDDDRDVEEISKNCQSLTDLSLGSNRYLSDALFNRIVSICPNLQSLSLFDCQISFHSGLYKRFYPNKDEASKSVLTFFNILKYIKQQARLLKHLNFGRTLIDGMALSTLTTVESLKLESLRLPWCDQLTSTGLRCLAYQTTLKSLDLSYCTRVTDACLVCISQNLPNLENLEITRCRGVTDLGVSRLNLLRKLRTLVISECDQLTGQCITEGLCCDPTKTDSSKGTSGNESQYHDSENVNPNVADPGSNDSPNNTRKFINARLESLSASALNLDERSIESIGMTFPQLRVLDVGYCFSAVTDKTIQTIFKELVFLRTLKLSRCDKVSDAGLTGMGAGSRKKVSPTRIDSRSETVGSKLRIRLGSRAEEEIVRDAYRKREVTEMCEDSATLIDHMSPGFSLIRLRGLRELDLSGCNRVTDVSLKHAFNFPELRILDLSMCQQITHVGLDYLTKNNPAIEDLNLMQCHNVTDTGISYVAQRLHRLKRLHLQSCSQLTDHSLDSIKIYCKRLQYLDARSCRGISLAGIESLSHLHVDYTEERDSISENRDIPVPPPLLRR